MYLLRIFRQLNDKPSFIAGGKSVAYSFYFGNLNLIFNYFVESSLSLSKSNTLIYQGAPIPPMDNLKKHATSSDNADQASGEVLDLHGSYTKEEEKAVLRKIDLVVLPLVRDSSYLGWFFRLMMHTSRCASCFFYNILTSRVSAMLVSSV